MSLLAGLASLRASLIAPATSCPPCCPLLLRQLSSLTASSSHTPTTPTPTPTPSPPTAADTEPTETTAPSHIALAHSIYRQLRRRGSVVTPAFAGLPPRQRDPISPAATAAHSVQSSRLPIRNYLDNAAILHIPQRRNAPRLAHRVLAEKHRLVLEHIVGTLQPATSGGGGEAGGSGAAAAHVPGGAVGVDRKAIRQALGSHFGSKMEFRNVLRDLCQAGLLKTYPPISRKTSSSFTYGPTPHLGEMWVRLQRSAAAAAERAAAKQAVREAQAAAGGEAQQQQQQQQ